MNHSNLKNKSIMKTIFNTFIVAVLMIAGCANAQAQEKFDENWKERMMSEKVAFLTVELNLSPEEAQVFWPVYNKVQKDIDQARGEIMRSFKELKEASESGKSEKELAQLLDKHVQAKIRMDELDNSTLEAFKKVLPVEKIAKLYVAEEKFRRSNISKLHKKPENK